MSSELEGKAKKKPATAQRGGANVYDQQFVRYELDESTKKALKLKKVLAEEIMDALSNMVLDGHKISIAKENSGDTVGVYATAPAHDHKNHGLCLTARGPDTFSALKVLLYKHFEAFDEVWPRERGERSELDAWGWPRTG